MLGCSLPDLVRPGGRVSRHSRSAGHSALDRWCDPAVDSQSVVTAIGREAINGDVVCASRGQCDREYGAETAWATIVTRAHCRASRASRPAVEDVNPSVVGGAAAVERVRSGARCREEIPPLRCRVADGARSSGRGTGHDLTGAGTPHCSRDRWVRRSRWTRDQKAVRALAV